MSFTNYTFASNYPFNSKLIESASGEEVLDIETTSELRNRTTTIRDVDGRIVGAYQRGWGINEVTHDGKRQPMSDWLPKKGWTSK